MTAIASRNFVVTFVAMVFTLSAAQEIRAQPAPIARAVVSANAAPEGMISMFAGLTSGERIIQIEGAQWLQLRFAEFNLGNGQLKVSSAVDEQTFTHNQLEDWEGLTAIFKGSEVTIILTPDASREISAKVGDVIIGLPGPIPEVGLESVWQPLINLLGDDLQRFIPTDTLRKPDGPNPEAELAPEAVCGSVDDRKASNHPASGRIMPIGCTGWIMQSGRLLTAGHCINTGTQTIEFNVPASAEDGTTVSPPVRDQYKIISKSIVDQYTDIGNDWAVFQVLPNTQTGLMPIDAQGTFFVVSNRANPATVRITGYGVDGPPPRFGRGPRNADNQTQQTHTGILMQNTGGPKTGTLRYKVDTQGGNSGSPVVVEGTNQTIGIHTNGGCNSNSSGANAGTSFRNQALWNAI